MKTLASSYAKSTFKFGSEICYVWDSELPININLSALIRSEHCDSDQKFATTDTADPRPSSSRAWFLPMLNLDVMHLETEVFIMWTFLFIIDKDSLT